MTEDKAKQILDFLARKIGYDEVVISRRFAMVGCRKQDDIHFLYMLSNDVNISTSICCSSSMSYAEALENILKMSKDANIYSGFVKNLFLRQNTSLEELLIEMDLKDELK